LSNGSSSNQTTRYITDPEMGDGTCIRELKYGIETASPRSSNGYWLFPTLGALGYTTFTYSEWSMFCVMSVNSSLLSGAWDTTFGFDVFSFSRYADTDDIVFVGGGNSLAPVYQISDFTSGPHIFCLKARPNPGSPGSSLLGRVVNGSFTEADMTVFYETIYDLSINNEYVFTTGNQQGGQSILPGAISEYRFYPNSFTNSEFMTIHAALKTKWGIT